jgi:histone deacetylase 1/2
MHGELAFAVHQCAHFAANPKQQHKMTLKKILRYLQGTLNEGLIITPKKDLGLKCYVDADFASGQCTIQNRIRHLPVWLPSPMV